MRSTVLRKKTAWLVTSGTLKMLRAAVDDAKWPLLSIENNQQMLLGRPLYVSPSLENAYSSIGLVGALLWGDLSHLIVRCSRPSVSRTMEQGQAGADFGSAMWNIRARADASYFPCSKVNKPIVIAAIS